MDFKVDEFDGSWFIGASDRESLEKTEVKKKKSGPKNSRYALFINVWLERKTATSPLVAKSTLTLLTPECIEFYQWDTKSDQSAANFTIDRDMYRCDEQKGYAIRVFEEQVGRYLSESEMVNYCGVMRGDNLKYRVRGYSGFMESSGFLPKSHIALHNDICTIFFGIQQGLEINIPTNQ